MIVVMNIGVSEQEIEAVRRRLEEGGFSVHPIRGVKKIVLGAIGDRSAMPSLGIELMPGVEQIIPISRPYKLASREVREENTVVRVGDVSIGGPEVVVIAGPCAVESTEQVMSAAWAAKRAGARMLRGGAFKPRTSPYSFQGLAEEGLKILAEAKKATGLPVVTEVVDERSAALAAEYVDVLQIGARNMQNFPLLKLVGQSKNPVLLKRGLSATIEEWLMAAEYVMSEGNYNVILCERGIRTFESATRNTLDISAIPVVKSLSHLPVLADPSHAAGDWKLVGPLAKAAVAAGADGLLIEMHPDPSRALCDGAQSLNPEGLAVLLRQLQYVAGAVGRNMGVEPYAS